MDDEPDVEPGDDLLYWAWSVIANAGHNRGGWDNEDPEWVAAAIRWRDAFHATLRSDAPTSRPRLLRWLTRPDR